MTVLSALATMLLFPCGLFLLANGLVYEWVDRKLIARLQNRLGPRWFQPLADLLKLMSKQDMVPATSSPFLFSALPAAAFAAVLTAALYTPMAGLAPAFSFPGDLIVVVYLLSSLTFCIGVAGQSTNDRFSIIGGTRVLTQFFAYEVPFMLALLGPAFTAQSWQISQITAYTEGHAWLLWTQPIGLVVALLSLMGKLEIPPFDAPEAETEIVAGALTEYGGRGLALFTLARKAALVVSLTLIAAFYLGGLANPLAYAAKTGLLLFVVACVHALLTRLRIDQTVTLWWRYASLLVLVQWLLVLVGRR